MIKKGKRIKKIIPYRLQFTDSARFMASSLSNPASNLAEEIQEIKCKFGHDEKNVKLAEMNKNIARAFLKTQTLS